MRGVFAITLVCLLTACGAKQREIPLREVTITELHEVSLPADSSELRLVVECSPLGVPSVRQIGGLGSKIQMDWELDSIPNSDESLLRVQALKPSETLQIPSTTTTKEVPVEVIQTEYRLAPWHRYLIALALLVLVANALRLYHRLFRQ